MERYLPQLTQSPLFEDCGASELVDMLRCLGAKRKQYPAKATIFPAGSKDFALGVVLDGSVDIVQDDFWGNQGMVARLAPGQVFAESFVLAQTPCLPVSVVAHLASEILLLDYRRILHTCTSACPHHERLLNNLLRMVARKNVYLTEKMEILAKKTIKERLLAFLAAEAQRAGSRAFTIAYDRQALADYLAVDRSALSRTLGEMRREGIVNYHRNAFELT